MKATETTPLASQEPKGPSPDRLTQVLILAAFFLIAALMALVTDAFLWPASDGPVARAVESTSLPPTPSHTSPPAIATAIERIEFTAQPSIEEATATPPTPEPCVPPNDWGIHVVEAGNTLYSLAQRYGTDVNTLMRVNCLNTHTIFTGQRLYVPGPLPSATELVPPPTSGPYATPTPWPTIAAVAAADMLTSATRAPTPAPTRTPPTVFQVDIPNRYLNIVLLGSDKRPYSGAWRTDSMIIVSVDIESNVVRLLSIPRDLWVYIPGHGYNRINTADLWGELARKGSGPEWIKRTIHHNLGIPIHYYVRVDFRGFIKIIDTVGGVDIDVDCPLPDINLSAGMHHMGGKEALRYARSRKSTSDFDRGRRQRKVLLALWEQALTLDIIPKLPELWFTMADSFQTDLPLDQVINLAYVGVQLNPQRIISRAIGRSHIQSWVTPQGAAVLLPREDKIRTLLENFYAPIEPNQLDTTNKVRVQVLNGSQRNQADELAAAALRWEGFKVVDSGPADRRDYAQTSIQVYNGNLDAAQQLAQQLQVPFSAIQDLSANQLQPNPENPVDIQVVLGANYNPCQR
jgi:LCP family protein required for cell wall assembly